MRRTTTRVLAAAAAVLLLAAGCASSDDPVDPGDPSAGPVELDEISVVLSWSAQPAQGGLFAAKVKGIFEEHGLDVTLVPSGPRVPRKPMLASGDVQFGMLSADEILISREEGLNLVALLSTMQQNPLGFVYHEENPLTDFTDLAGRTVFVAPGQAWWQYLLDKYDLTLTEQAYQGLAPFLADSTSVTQGFLTSEPFYAQAEGVAVGFLPIEQSGWATYMNMIATTDEFIARNPDVVERFVKATLEGWLYYMENPDEINAEILKENELATPEAQRYDTERLIPLLQAGDTPTHGFGYINPVRWGELGAQLKANGLLPDSADLSAGYNPTFWEAASGS
jgi:NitT/TauT family transport system substrate-binding protein